MRRIYDKQINRDFRGITDEGTTLTIYNDGTVKNNQNQNICLAFTVDDIDKEYEKILALGARIHEPPKKGHGAQSI